MNMRTKLIAAMLLGVSWLGIPLPVSAVEHPNAAEFMSTAFDSDYPGRGIDWFLRETAEANIPLDHDMAYAFYASSAAALGDVVQARKAADFLVAHAYDNSQGIGWGMAFIYDSCDSGTPNRLNTIYMVYTAEAVKGLLDVYELTGDETYKETARLALVDQMKYFHYEKVGVYNTGWFPYATSVADQDCSILNVSAMEMGQYARASVLFNSASFSDVARRIHNYLWFQRHEADGLRWWTYYANGTNDTDAVHSAYMVQGYHDFVEYLGPRQDLTPAVDYLADHFDLNGHINLWGIGMLIGTLSNMDRPVDAAFFRDRLTAEYEYAPYQYGYYAGFTIHYVRPAAHVLWGLTQLEQIE